MIRIIRHEWRLLAADPGVWLTVLLLAGSIGYALWNGAGWARFQQAAIAGATQDTERRVQRLLSMMDTIPADAAPPEPFTLDPRVPALVGGSVGAPYAMLPPTPLAALAVGQSDLHASYVKISTRSQQTVASPEEIDNPSNLVTGRFDLAFVLVYLLPLLVLVLSYDLLSSEREQGTIGLLLSQPISLRRLLLAKIASRVALVIAVVVGTTLVGLWFTGAMPNGDGVAERLLLWIGVVIGYALFWLGLAAAVNLAGWSSATNAIALAAAWLALALVGPALLNVAVKSTHPVPSRVELIGALREASNEANTRGSALLARYYEDHPELVPASDSLDLEDFMTRLYSVQDAVDRELAPLLAQFDSQLTRQQALVRRFRIFSPAIATQEALSDISGTGLARYTRFREQVAAFQRVWQDFFVPRIFRRALLTRADYDAMPRFSYREESNGEVAGRVLNGLAGLVVPLVLVWSLVALGLRRYTVAER
jgi:ABC-2 type transport system permease protein